MLRQARIISAICGLMCASACGSPGQTQFGERGQVSFELILGDLEIGAVGFTLEGSDFGSPLTGQFSVHDAQDPPVWATIMALAPGDYIITLEAFDLGGQIVCAGTSDFTIVAGVVTTVDVLVLCSGVRQDGDLGHTVIDATLKFVKGTNTGTLAPHVFSRVRHPPHRRG